jgi:hypothetical protein
MVRFKAFRSARIIIAGIETMHMIRKSQLGDIKNRDSSAADQFYLLVILITATVNDPRGLIASSPQKRF